MLKNIFVITRTLRRLTIILVEGAISIHRNQNFPCLLIGFPPELCFTNSMHEILERSLKRSNSSSIKQPILLDTSSCVFIINQMW